MPAKFDRCVKTIIKQNKKNKKKYNPYAVCQAAMKK